MDISLRLGEMEVKMDGGFIERKVDSLLNDLKEFVESRKLSDDDTGVLEAEIDRLLYECLYYKARLVG